MNLSGYEIAFALTALFLVSFFAYAGVAASRRNVSGRFRGLKEDLSPAAGMLMRTAVVDLPDGSTVEAELSSCVLCQGRFRPGDTVNVRRVGRGYQLSIPMFGGDACGRDGGC